MKVLARRWRRRGRAGRRTARLQGRNGRDQAFKREFIIGTHNVLTVAMNGKYGVGQAAEVPGRHHEIDWAIVGL